MPCDGTRVPPARGGPAPPPRALALGRTRSELRLFPREPPGARSLRGHVVDAARSGSSPLPVLAVGDTVAAPPRSPRPHHADPWRPRARAYSRPRPRSGRSCRRHPPATRAVDRAAGLSLRTAALPARPAPSSPAFKPRLSRRSRPQAEGGLRPGAWCCLIYTSRCGDRQPRPAFRTAQQRSRHTPAPSGGRPHRSPPDGPHRETARSLLPLRALRGLSPGARGRDRLKRPQQDVSLLQPLQSHLPLPGRPQLCVAGCIDSARPPGQLGDGAGARWTLSSQ